jgi:hypothetical protein
MAPVHDQDRLRQICDFINDMIGDTDIVATPGDFLIAWQRKFAGKGQYPVEQSEAFYRLTRAGHNPMALIEFATNQAGSPPKE